MVKKPYKTRGRPEKNPRKLRIDRLKEKGLYPSDEQRAAQSAAAKAKKVSA